MAVNNDREEFRKYLQDSGAVKALSNVLMKLYELRDQRPKTAVIYIHDNLLNELPSLTEFENLQAQLNATSAILEDLKMNGNLNDSQLAMINNIMSSTPGQAQIGNFISARQSQIVKGNHDKTSRENQCRISKMDKNDPNYDVLLKDQVELLLNDTKCKSLLKTHLNMALFDSLKNEKTSSGSTLIDCISSGLEIHESMVGVYAADAEAYAKFKDLFDPIIEDYHGGFTSKDNHTMFDWGDPTTFINLDPNQQYITSTRIRCVRTVKNFPLVPTMAEDQFSELCKNIKPVLENLTGDVQGIFYELDTMDANTKSEMIKNRYILEHGDRFLEAAGATKFWAKGRAVYINANKTFFIWVNEEDHLRFISMEAGFNIPVVYQRLKDAVEQCSTNTNNLTFETDPHLGYLSLCPTNLGNTIRASVMIKVPKVVKEGLLQGLADQFKLEIRGGQGNDANNMVEISNKRKLGLTEFDSIKELYDGIKAILEKEQSL